MPTGECIWQSVYVCFIKAMKQSTQHKQQCMYTHSATHSDVSLLSFSLALSHIKYLKTTKTHTFFLSFFITHVWFVSLNTFSHSHTHCLALPPVYMHTQQSFLERLLKYTRRVFSGLDSKHKPTESYDLINQ